MQRYKILKSFKGSQDGRFTEEFQAGTEAELSEYLVSCVPENWIKAVTAAAPTRGKKTPAQKEPEPAAVDESAG
jgi:hypothetical protein